MRDRKLLLALIAVLMCASSSIALAADIVQWAKSQCQKSDVAEARSRAKEARARGDLHSAESILAETYKKCVSTLYSGSDLKDDPDNEPTYLMIGEYLEVLAKETKFSECAGKASNLAHWGVMRGEIDDRPWMIAIRSQFEACVAARNKEFGFNTSVYPCKNRPGNLGDYVGSPPGWAKSSHSGECFKVSPGKAMSSEEWTDRELRPDEYPYLESISYGKSGQLIKKRYDFNGGLLGEHEHCGSLSVQTGSDARHPRLRITGGVGYCWPGNAAYVVDSIYELTAAGLVLVDDLSTATH